MFSRILVPTEFSDRCAQAARHASALAAQFQSEIIALHVTGPLHFDFAMAEPAHELERAAEANLKKLEQRLAAFARAEFRDQAATSCLLREGEPADEILRVATEEKVDLIVMSTRGRSRLRHFLIGSVAAKVLHDAPVPVWSGTHLHHDVNFPAFRLTNVLCAVDFGSRTSAALRCGGSLAKEFGARLTVLNIVEGGKTTAEAKSRLEGLLAEAGLEGSVMVETGEPHKIVSATAGQMHADVVVIGRACSTGMMGRLREQAYGIVRDSPCPVLSV